MPEVRCTVNNCVYWERGNRCSADSILIAHDSAAHTNDDNVEVADLDYTPANVSSATCCKTFKPKKG